MRAAILATSCVLLLAGAVAVAQNAQVSVSAFPSGRTETLHIVQWQGRELPRLYERSEQLPLTDEELAKLAGAGFTPAQMVKMIEERRCACDASAEGLIRLKEQGVPPEVLSALSLHALKPNRALGLELTVDAEGEGTLARNSHLYVFIDDGKITRTLTFDLGALLATGGAIVDQSDPVRPKKVRRFLLAGTVPLKTYGKHKLLVVSSARKLLNHPSQLPPADLARAQSFEFDYPRVSLENTCRLDVGFKRDVALAHRWNLSGSRLECEWN